MRRALLVVLVSICPGVCLAHEPGLSALAVRVADTRIVAELTLAASDARALPAAALSTAVELRIDGRLLPATAQLERAGDGGVRVRLVWPRPVGDRIAIGSRVPRLLSAGHRQLVSVQTPDGQVLTERMVGAADDEVVVTLAGPQHAPAAASFLWLGLEHIAGGFDHLLFVAALLLGVRRTSEAVKTVTAFTAAHSVTLAASTLEWVQLPGTIVEPLIAASIVYVAAENLVRGAGGSRTGLTFAFGLIHGFGFAGALRDLGVAGGGIGIALPLAAFNLGVEAGQVVLVLMLMPLLSRLRAHPTLAGRTMAAASAFVLAAGAWWLVERLTR
jgi:hypothetical protein